jgi:hypothetical protein
MQRFLTTVFCVSILAGAALAQDRDDDSASRMRQWMQDQRQEFEDYVSAQDREFAAFLDEAWREFDLLAGRVRDDTPKPREVPMAPKPVTPPAPPARPDETPLPDTPPPPRRPEPPSTRPDTREIDVEYLGLVYRLPADRRLGELPRRATGPEGAAAAWLDLSRCAGEDLVAALARQAAERQLGDWGLFRLLETVAHAYYPGDPSRRALLHWYLAVRAGLDVRLAYAAPGYAVLYATEQAVYQLHFLVREKTAYYIHDPAGRFASTETLRSYDARSPGELRPISFDLGVLPLTEPELVERTLDWALNGEPRETVVTLDRRLVDYLAGVPQTELETNFAAALSPRALRSLAESLAPELEVRDATGRVAVLLYFVQTALPYATDQEQFGREDYLYPDEALFYPACDCEDRAALFAVLVRELVGLDVVGLDYPGHIATAVALPGDPPGDRFTWRDVVFTVCDPTYIGAGLGRSMPITGATTPGIIDVTG